MIFTGSTFSVPVEDAGRINGIAETLEVANPMANMNADILTNS